jgi:hypothetical protein
MKPARERERPSKEGQGERRESWRERRRKRKERSRRGGCFPLAQIRERDSEERERAGVRERESELLYERREESVSGKLRPVGINSSDQ